MSSVVNKGIRRLFPRGLAWLLPPGGISDFIDSVADTVDDLRVFLAGIVTESQPPTATDTMPEWFAAYNIAYDSTQTLAKKRAIITERWTAQGGVSRGYLQSQVEKAGFEDITIEPITQPDGASGSIVGEAIVGAATCWSPASGGPTDWMHYFRVVGTVDTLAEYTRLQNLINRIAYLHLEPVYSVVVVADLGYGVVGVGICGEATVGYAIP